MPIQLVLGLGNPGPAYRIRGRKAVAQGSGVAAVVDFDDATWFLTSPSESPPLGGSFVKPNVWPLNRSSSRVAAVLTLRP